ncbi:Uncharacterized protein APZ42_025421 [Daphnia magna]|uniref:Uncharacterized protein n=1 Tax=Daphnia magna TaxID=35525 RepID=A0A162DD94_9CRUS|nr:Uncharacterized protein APZ42_025421 [Daphnia magna]
MKSHSSTSIEYTTNIYEYMDKTFSFHQKHTSTVFKSASECLSEYPRIVDVDDGSLIIRDFHAKYPHIIDTTIRKRFLDKFSQSLKLLAKRTGEDIVTLDFKHCIYLTQKENTWNKRNERVTLYPTSTRLAEEEKDEGENSGFYTSFKNTLFPYGYPTLMYFLILFWNFYLLKSNAR